MNREPYQIDGVEYFYGCASDVDSHFSGLEIDIIYHLGEYSRVEQSLTEPLQCVKNISHSFISILEFARKKSAKLIYSGSSTKFATGLDGKTLSPYTFCKAVNTELLMAYENWYGLNMR